MSRPRINPHRQGTPEHLIYQRWRASCAKAHTIAREADRLRIEADAEQAKADHYARALDALGYPPGGRKLLEGPRP